MGASGGFLSRSWGACLQALDKLFYKDTHVVTYVCEGSLT